MHLAWPQVSSAASAEGGPSPAPRAAVLEALLCCPRGDLPPPVCPLHRMLCTLGPRVPPGRYRYTVRWQTSVPAEKAVSRQVSTFKE